MLKKEILILVGVLLLVSLVFYCRQFFIFQKVLGVSDNQPSHLALGQIVLNIFNKKQICVDENNLHILVDKNKGISPDYVPPDLVSLQKFGVKTINGDKQLRIEAAYHLRGLQKAFNKNFSTDFYVSSAYRSYTHQKQLKQSWLSKLGIAAEYLSANAGHSEHQLGTTVDISFGLEELKTDNPKWLWLKENAHNYGFVLSYDYEDKDFTGYDYEPWHWRYVGVDLAKSIFNSNKMPLLFYQPKGCYFVEQG